MALNRLKYYQTSGLAHDLILPDPLTPDAVIEQFFRIVDAVNELSEMVPQACQVEPERPREPMIRLAMLPWNPTGTNTEAGQLVVYHDGAWHLLNLD